MVPKVFAKNDFDRVKSIDGATRRYKPFTVELGRVRYL